MNLTVLTVILFGHWLSDFVLQKNKKSTRKKIKYKNVKHILPHTLLYTTILTIGVNLLCITEDIYCNYKLSVFYFFTITYITHFITDLVVTKINSKFLKKNQRHNYIVMIGFDQFIHATTLILIYNLIQ